jgi:gamma-glutamyl hercynylcysteine S-oxide hydrolase
VAFGWLGTPEVCRHLAWLGAPRTVSSLVLDPPSGLLRQSYAPRRQRRGRLNADGWGVGLYAADQVEPVRWRSDRPLWSDASFASVAPVLSSTCVLAAVRSATKGMPVAETATAPFSDGRWLLSHNGRVDRATLTLDGTAESTCDSALLAVHVFARGPDQLGATVIDLARRDPHAVLNLLMTDGHALLATTWGDTLSYLETSDGFVVASEPWDDDPGWRDVPDHHLVQVIDERITLTELEKL